MVYTFCQGSLQLPWLKSHHTGRCLSSQISEKQLFNDTFPSMSRAIMNLVFKGHKCRTIQMDALDNKGLKSKMIDNNKLEVLWTMKPLTTCAMHAC